MDQSYALIGGDRRQLYLADLLAREGHSVVTFGLPGTETERSRPLEQAAQADVILLPLPLSREGRTLNAEGPAVPLKTLFSKLPKDRPVLAGQVSPAIRQMAEESGVRLIDYYAREELAVANAVPSAEGAVYTAMEHSPATICGCSCLVIGYGRIGKLLAQRLYAWGANVTVAARSCEARTWIRASGLRAADTAALSGRLKEFDIIFNTVPAPVLSEAETAELDRRCLWIELASVPGMDLEAARARGVNAVWARGLPGRLFPQSAAAAIRETVAHILIEGWEGSV